MKAIIASVLLLYLNLKTSIAPKRSTGRHKYINYSETSKQDCKASIYHPAKITATTWSLEAQLQKHHPSPSQQGQKLHNHKQTTYLITSKLHCAGKIVVNMGISLLPSQLIDRLRD